MLRKLTKLVALGLLTATTLVASSDAVSARNWGRGYRGGYGAPVVRYYGGSRVYGGYNAGYIPRVYNGYYGAPYVNRYYGNRVYNNGYYGNGYYNNGYNRNNYYGNGYYNNYYGNGNGYGNGYYGGNVYGPGRVGISIGW